MPVKKLGTCGKRQQLSVYGVVPVADIVPELPYIVHISALQRELYSVVFYQKNTSAFHLVPSRPKLLLGQLIDGF